MIDENKEILENVKTKGETIALDFDGVIHSYKRGWTGLEPKDPPMDGVEEALKKLKDKKYRLVIMSTRPKENIQKYLEKYGLDKYFSGIYNTKIPAKLYLDDRGVHFSNWNDALHDIDNFKKG